MVPNEEFEGLLRHSKTDTGNRIGAVACYFILGTGILAPWNAFLTAIDYFSRVYVSSQGGQYGTWRHMQQSS